MRKIIFTIYGVLGLAILGILVGFILDRENQTIEYNYNQESINNSTGEIIVIEEKEISDEVEEYIEISHVAKLVSLAKESKGSIEQRELEFFVEVETSNWYDKYMNIGLVEGWLDEAVVNDAGNLLDYGSFQRIITYFDVDDLILNQVYEKNEFVSYDDFWVFYNQLLEKYNESTSPEFKELYVFNINESNIATDYGRYSTEGIDLASFLDKKILALIRDSEILAVEEVYVDSPVLTGAFIKEYNAETKKAEIFMGGDTRVLTVDDFISLDNVESDIADVQILNNTLVYVKQIDTMVAGVVKKISREEVELEGLGKIDIREDCKIYNTVDEVDFTNIYDLLVGYSTALYYTDEEYKIVAIEVMKKPSIENIRVAINNSDFNSLYHSEVKISSDYNYEYTLGDDKRLMTSDKELDVSELGMAIGDRLVITNEEGFFQVQSITRGWGSSKFNPTYRGSLEIEKTENGYIIVNEVDFEEYLYGVVPSEMPVSHGLEALKVQAVCARSYAYIQFYSNSYCKYGAHVDDSTMSQVYNNTTESDVANQAVDETSNMLLGYNGTIISTNFFSTSCGVTSNVGEVWANYKTKAFPTTSVSYLQFNVQNESGILNYNLQEENEFKAFINDDTFESFDSQYSWYRWNVLLSKDNIEESIKSTISNRFEAVPRLIKTQSFDGSYKSREIADIGELVDIEINNRGESGIVTELLIITTEGQYLVSTEYNVRKLLAPVDHVGESVVINRGDGSTVSSMSLLPSGYFYMDKSYDDSGKLASVNFVGGGYGHGVGMSQNGVKTMVDLGYNYEEILNHYYSGTEVVTR